MTIARRLTLLLAIPLIALIGLGFFVVNQIRQDRVAEPVCPGSADQQPRDAREHFARFRGDAGERSRLPLAKSGRKQARAEALLDRSQSELTRLLAKYGDGLISSDKDRRLFTEYRELIRAMVR